MEELLKKYMRHIAEVEGTSFVDDLNNWMCTQKFTDEEVKTLERIEKEIIDEY